MVGLVEEVVYGELEYERVTAAEGGFQGEVDQVIRRGIGLRPIKGKKPVLCCNVFQLHLWTKGSEEAFPDLPFMTQGAEPLEGRDKGKVALRVEAAYERQHIVPLKDPFWVDVEGGFSAI